MPTTLGWSFLRRFFASLARSSRIGRYRVIGLIGEGGMGRVYLAEDETLRRPVAVKILKRADEASRRRFIQEGRAAARLSHPNLCPIYDVGEHGGLPFLAMELLSGETLAARIARGTLAPGEVAGIAEDLLSALAALHDAGLVHRDVKPSNFFLTPNGGKLLDFGLARELPAEVERELGTTTPDVTRPGQLRGTPGYMAPEQILGHAVDARTDLFAAGATLYEALTGHRPFAGTTPAAVASSALYDEPAPLVGSPGARGARSADSSRARQEAGRALRRGAGDGRGAAPRGAVGRRGLTRSGA